MSIEKKMAGRQLAPGGTIHRLSRVPPSTRRGWIPCAAGKLSASTVFLRKTGHTNVCGKYGFWFLFLNGHLNCHKKGCSLRRDARLAFLKVKIQADFGMTPFASEFYL
jgi:hypothetical protein